MHYYAIVLTQEQMTADVMEMCLLELRALQQP